MRIFLRLLALQFIASLLFVLFFRDGAIIAIGKMGQTLPTSIWFFLQQAWWVLLLFAGLLVFAPRKILLKRVPMAVVAVIASNLLAVTFSMVKTSLPLVFPFWADPMLADVDLWLHFGVDPWRLTHALPWDIPLGLAEGVYTRAWLVPAMYFPVFLVLFDGNKQRISRYLVIYIAVWLGLGNFLAGAFMSAGPVYYDQVVGGDRFAPMLEALQMAGIAQSMTGQIQNHLWEVYQTSGQQVGSGISAFPSVHVAMATLIALYLAERSRLFWPLSVLIIITFQFLSVYLGWHYAIDGYFSILFIVALIYASRIWLRRLGHASLQPSA